MNKPCLSEGVYTMKQTVLIETKNELAETKEELERAYGYLKDTEDRLKDIQRKRNQEKAAADKAVAEAEKQLHDMSIDVLKVIKRNEELDDEARDLRNALRIKDFELRELQRAHGVLQAIQPFILF
jgi:hypothetical protein